MLSYQPTLSPFSSSEVIPQGSAGAIDASKPCEYGLDCVGLAVTVAPVENEPVVHPVASINVFTLYGTTENVYA